MITLSDLATLKYQALLFVEERNLNFVDLGITFSGELIIIVGSDKNDNNRYYYFGVSKANGTFNTIEFAAPSIKKED
jgi:hypothetical protein